MKKLVLLALLAATFLAPYANAKIDPDAEMLEMGAVDSDYNVIHENVFTAYMQYLNASMLDHMHKNGELSPDPNEGLSFDADGLLVKMKYAKKVPKKDKAAVVRIANSDMNKKICSAMFFNSSVLVKRNWNLRMEVYDSTNALISSLNRRVQDCPEVVKKAAKKAGA